jgi:hypothetical protein
VQLEVVVRGMFFKGWRRFFFDGPAEKPPSLPENAGDPFLRGGQNGSSGQA